MPGAYVLLRGDKGIAQLILSDLLGHTGHIWDHVVAWARANSLGDYVRDSNEEMARKYAHWKEVDPLLGLPPP